MKKLSIVSLLILLGLFSIFIARHDFFNPKEKVIISIDHNTPHESAKIDPPSRRDLSQERYVTSDYLYISRLTWSADSKALAVRVNQNGQNYIGLLEIGD